jgi:hypothetical protein
MAIGRPVEKVKTVTDQLPHGSWKFRRTRDFGVAKQTAKEAAERRRQDLEHDLYEAGRAAPHSTRPEAQPAPDPVPRPEPVVRPTPVPKPAPAPVPPDEEATVVPQPTPIDPDDRPAAA